MTTVSSLTTVIEPTQPSCREFHCNTHGSCVAPDDGGIHEVCECDLGYTGEFCEDTIHGSLSLPLTLGVLGFIVGALILAYVVAKLRQRQKKNRRRHLGEKYAYDIAV